MYLKNRLRRNRRGATIVVMAFMMIVILGMVAFAVDVGRMYLVRAQLQSAVDAGALAASLQLKSDPNDVDAAVAAAQQFVQYNRVGWAVTVPADAITVETGTWDDTTGELLAATGDPNAVRVSGNLENEPLFFAAVMGHNSYSIPRTAVAKGGGSSLDIMMTLDLSGSMGSQGRIGALRDAAPVFVEVIEEVGDNDRIGVMGYGAVPDQYDPAARGHRGTEYLLAPPAQYPSGSDWVGVLESGLTSDIDVLRSNVLDSGTLTANKYNGWTPVGAALRDSAHYLSMNSRPTASRVIVLMSDGHANKPSGYGPGYAREMALYAASLNIRVYTISLGNGADEDLMQDIADVTQAEHFLATGSGQVELSERLEEAFRKIAGAIKRTELVQ